MKLFTLALTLCSTLAFSAAVPRFSAFSSNDKVYITVLGDTCNARTGSIAIGEDCEETAFDVDIRFCSADLLVKSTKRMCITSSVKPVVFTIDLKKSGVQESIETLELNYAGQRIEVKLDR